MLGRRRRLLSRVVCWRCSALESYEYTPESRWTAIYFACGMAREEDGFCLFLTDWAVIASLDFVLFDLVRGRVCNKPRMHDLESSQCTRYCTSHFRGFCCFHSPMQQAYADYTSLQTLKLS